MSIKILRGDCREVLRTMPDESVHCVVTSPPYWGLRDYGTATWEGGDAECEHAGGERRCDKPGRNDKQGTHKGTASDRIAWDCIHCGARRIDSQLGLEPTYQEYVASMVEVFREVRRVLRKDGTLWLNMGSSYAGGGRGEGGAFTSERRAYDGMNAIQSRQHEHVPACDSDGKEQPNSTGLGLSCHDLCDGCLSDFLTHHGRTNHNGQQPSLGALPVSPKAHGNGHLDFASASLPVLPRDVPLSTKIESWRRQRGECSRCDSRAFGLSAARSFSAGARESAHNSCLNYSTIKFKAKDLVPIPWLVAMALQKDGWVLRQDLIWSKPNPMPESVRDRCTKAHEYLFLLSKSERYYYDAEAIREDAEYGRRSNFRGGGAYLNQSAGQANGEKPSTSSTTSGADSEAGRNKRSVWEISTSPFPEAHFATFPPALIEPCILAGCPKEVCAECGAPWMRDVERTAMVLDRSERTHSKGHTRSSGTMIEPPKSITLGWSPSCSCGAGTTRGTVLDPFGGAGTTGLVADRLGRNAILIELNPQYAEMAERRLKDDAGMFAEVL